MFYIDTESEFLIRYDFRKFMEYLSSTYDIFNSYFLLKLKDLPIFGTHIVVEEEYKPSLLSYNIYKDTQYWPVIMAYNNFTRRRHIVIGIVVKYPSIADLEELYFSLKAVQRTLG